MTIYDPAALKLAADYLRDHGRNTGGAESQLRHAARESEEELSFVTDLGRRLKSDAAAGITNSNLGELAVTLIRDRYDLQLKTRAVSAGVPA